jgi:hypothetical protein
MAKRHPEIVQTLALRIIPEMKIVRPADPEEGVPKGGIRKLVLRLRLDMFSPNRPYLCVEDQNPMGYSLAINSSEDGLRRLAVAILKRLDAEPVRPVKTRRPKR